MALIEARLDLVPESPGVYLMKDDTGSIIYVGKAINLRNRLRSYFGENPKGTQKVMAMIEHIASFDFVLCRNELEALVLESNLIKQYQPFYNILLKDDRDYPYLKITWNEDYPRILKAYRVEEDQVEGARYYGPFLAGDLRQAIHTLHQIFPLKTCRRVFPRDIGKERPCLNYHIHRCIGPCLGSVTKEEYRAVIADVCAFLDGKYQTLLGKMEEEMHVAAEDLQFEKAASLRDRRASLLRLLEQNQYATLSRDLDVDIVAITGNTLEACVQKLIVRGGKVIGAHTFFLDGSDEDLGEVLESFLLQHYMNRTDLPADIFLCVDLFQSDVLQNLQSWLTAQNGQKVSFTYPQRGENRKLYEMALQTATEALVRHTNLQIGRSETKTKGLELLSTVCGLDKVARRIEAYDISNQGNQDIVCAMTVFQDGKAERSAYRSFTIRSIAEQDDFAAMREALNRRFTRLADANFGAPPDLLLIDGGKTHVSLALEVLAGHGLADKIRVAGMVKDNKHCTRGLVLSSGKTLELAKNIQCERLGIAFSQETNSSGVQPRLEEQRILLKFLTAIQNETHRRALLTQQKRSQKRQLRYRLEDIPGVGPATRTKLLHAFLTLKAISLAEVAALQKEAGLNLKTAQAVYDYFHQGEKV